MSSPDFRDHLLHPDSPRVLSARGLDPRTYAEPILATPRAQALNAGWQRLYAEPFRGVTADGRVEDGLFVLADEGFEPEAAVWAAEALMASLDGLQRERASHAVDADEWRAWYNPEIPFNDHGIRMDEAPERARAPFLDLLRACTSAKGFAKVRQLLSANLYLGEIYDLRNIMNEWSYHFLLFGRPSATEPWGWSLYGHHVAFNVFVLGRQLVVSPTFMGVEPNVIDRGGGDSFALFEDEGRLGLALMRSLPPEMRARATVYALMEDPAMPPGRVDFADQRHLGGAFQDNRVIPIEGVCAAEFTPAQRDALLATVESFVEHLPDGPRAARMAEVARHLDRTWWSWIGGHGPDDPFYFRIQSPVLMVEFDHHSGMWLTNAEPAKFHVHTITRTPNGNDYGRALLALHRRHAAAA